MERIERHTKLTALLLTILFVGFFCSNTLFVHTHKVNDTIIVHSHPFKSESHSSTSFSLISALNHYVALAAHISVFIPVAKVMLYVVSTCILSSCRKGYTHFVSLRAPPALSVF